MNKLEYIHYNPVGDSSLGRLISRLDAPDMTHLELEMWDIKDFEILTQCHRAFRPATNVTLTGFTFTDDVALGAIHGLLPMASHVDLTSASGFLKLIANSALPLWPKLALLRIQEHALGDLNRMVGGMAIERLEVYCLQEPFTPEAIVTNIRKTIETVTMNSTLSPRWYAMG
jgi:hypothetical protein